MVHLGHQLDIPVRHFTPGVHYCGEFYAQDEQGQSISGRLEPHFLARVIPNCHLVLPNSAAILRRGTTSGALTAASGSQSSQVLCLPHLRNVLEEERVSLISFAQLQPALKSLTAGGSWLPILPRPEGRGFSGWLGWPKRGHPFNAARAMRDAGRRPARQGPTPAARRSRAG